ncbi:hypothetical protein HDV05_006303 [Chytridiales sp. JEL 0842]|nr:hypothetical protein HDV05_006303 [Chytridiales sp. JEL 0842]
MKLDQTLIADLESIDPVRLPAYYKSTDWIEEVGEIEVRDLQGGVELAYQPVPGIYSDISLQGGGTHNSPDSSDSPSDSIPAEHAIDLSNDLSSSTCAIPTQLPNVGDGSAKPSSLIDHSVVSSDEEERTAKQRENEEVGEEDDGFELDLQPQLRGVDEKDLLADDSEMMLWKDWHPRSRQTMSRDTLQNLVKESTQLPETEEYDFLCLMRLLSNAAETMKDAIGDLVNEYDGNVQSLLDVDILTKVKDVFDVPNYHRSFLKRIKAKATKTNRSIIRTMLNHPTNETAHH